MVNSTKRTIRISRNVPEIFRYIICCCIESFSQLLRKRYLNILPDIKIYCRLNAPIFRKIRFSSEGFHLSESSPLRVDAFNLNDQNKCIRKLPQGGGTNVLILGYYCPAHIQTRLSGPNLSVFRRILSKLILKTFREIFWRTESH